MSWEGATLLCTALLCWCTFLVMCPDFSRHLLLLKLFWLKGVSSSFDPLSGGHAVCPRGQGSFVTFRHDFFLFIDVKGAFALSWVDVSGSRI